MKSNKRSPFQFFIKITIAKAMAFMLLLFAASRIYGIDIADYDELRAALWTNATDNKTLNITDNIDFTRNIIIQGNNATTIDGGADGKVFDGQGIQNFGASGISVSRIISFSNLTFQNFQAQNNGAAISLNADDGFANISASSFTLNVSSQSGGAVYVQFHTSITFSADIAFVDNRAIKSGGGLYLDRDTRADFTNEASTAYFVGNRTENGDGGAIFIEKSSISFNSYALFSANEAGGNGRGGGMFAQKSTVIFNAPVSFLGNKASGGQGGGLYLADSFVEFNSSISFVNNESAEGGALYLFNTDVNFTRELFFEGSLANAGGSVYAARSTLTFSTTTFHGNRYSGADSAISGGALHATSGSWVYFTALTSFTNNNSQRGGALHLGLAGSTVIFSAKTFFITNTGHSRGGAIYVANGFLKISSAIFESNIGGEGGAIYVSGGLVEISSTYFYQNSGSNGGALYISGGHVNISTQGNASLRFFRNKGSNGGAVYISGGKLTAPEVYFHQNNGSGNGGALYLTGRDSQIDFYGRVSFSSNAANGSGGAAYFTEYSSLTFKKAVSFTSNTANAEGAAFRADRGSNIRFEEGAIFFGNSAQSYGGAISARDGSDIRFVGDVSFTSNSAKERGGAINAMDGSAVRFEGNVAFTSNSADQRGGALYIERGTITFSKPVRFVFNKAGASGGVINMEHNESSLVFESFVSFASNTAMGPTAFGGAINMEAGALIFKSSAVFVGNETQIDGGALRISGNSNVSFSSGASFIGNKAIGNGGAISLSAGRLTIDIRNGGQISFANNSAAGRAGDDIYIDNDGTMTVRMATGKLFALDGGIYIIGRTEGEEGNIKTSNLIIEGGTFTLRSASKNKFEKAYLELNDAIWNIESELNFSDSSIGGANAVINKKTDETIDLGKGFHNSHTLNLNKGTIIISGGSASMKELNISSNAKFVNFQGRSGEENQPNTVTTVSGDINIHGTLSIFLDLHTGSHSVLNAGGNIYVNPRFATLQVDVIGIGRVQEVDPDSGIGSNIYRIITVTSEDNEFSGGFKSVIFEPRVRLTTHTDDKGYIISDVERLSDLEKYTSGFNSMERSIAKELDRIYMDTYLPNKMSRSMFDMLWDLNVMGQRGDLGSLKEALNALSGLSILNALRLGAVESQGKIDSLYMNIDIEREKTAWADIYTQRSELEDKDLTEDKFTSEATGFLIGADLYNNGSFVGGAYAGYGNFGTKQGRDDSAIRDFDAGLYGGYFAGKMRIKVNMAFSVQNFITHRNMTIAADTYKPTSSFDMMGARFGAEAQYIIPAPFSYEINIKPFAGLRGGFTRNNEIEEYDGGPTNLFIKENSYFRMDGLLGAALADEMGPFKWFGKLYGAYVFAGAKPVYQVRFAENGQWIDIDAIEEGFRFGMGGGLEYFFTDRADGISVFSNADIYTGKNAFGYYGAAGLRYRY